MHQHFGRKQNKLFNVRNLPAFLPSCFKASFTESQQFGHHSIIKNQTTKLKQQQQQRRAANMMKCILSVALLSLLCSRIEGQYIRNDAIISGKKKVTQMNLLETFAVCANFDDHHHCNRGLLRTQGCAKRSSGCGGVKTWRSCVAPRPLREQLDGSFTHGS